MTSKRQKPVEVDLRLAPMVMAELDLAGKFPEKGPLIICEATGVAWQAKNFREKWRKVATAAGVPNHVWNMDSRAGAITEGTDVAAMDDVRRTATHSNVSQTQAYSRDDTKAIARVMKGRAASRNKAGTDAP
jgi:site-specific recombinase XerC